jgi:hypothetical protein
MGLKHLAIELSPDHVKFTSLSDGFAITEKSFSFKDKKDYRYKEQLDEFILESGLKDRDHDEHTVSWASHRATLIPTNVFGESNPEAIFRLCFGNTIPASDIDYNRIPEIGIVNVFEIPMWVKSYFVIRHPRSIIQHESSMILRSLFTNTPFKTKIILTAFDKHFVLSIAGQGKLLFYSVFDFQTAEDILYNLMFTLQQKELTDSEGELIWCNGTGANPDLFDAFSELKKKVKNLDLLQLKNEPNFMLNSHKLCV